VVIAPCHHSTGTNALFLRPADLIPFAFGPDSFAAHCASARAIGVEPTVYRTQSLAFDLDTPADWREYVEVGNRESGAGD
jgi:2-phospho-L-lactate guanylyltransferase